MRGIFEAPEIAGQMREKISRRFEPPSHRLRPMVRECEWFAPERTSGDRTMTSFRKTATATLAALTLATFVLATAGGAEARPRHRGPHWGVGAGIVGALAVGGLLAASASNAYAAPAYDDDEPVRRCDMVERVNRFGEVVGYRKVCSLY
jgi:hypothetical protein